ncbi:unnamed protein product [Effrenium voratum]|uniref:Uncharacterized protein n=1 Tax=Effrenium voratum TaxID=2562239 RepID=A0AA36JIF0_9DINO|nr:unnamed protein product [Effrenium voratum]
MRAESLSDETQDGRSFDVGVAQRITLMIMDTGRKLEELAQELDNAWKRTRTRSTSQTSQSSFRPPARSGTSRGSSAQKPSAAPRVGAAVLEAKAEELRRERLKELRRREEAQAASKAEEAQRAAKTTQRDSRGQPQRTPSFGEVPKFGKEGRAHPKSLPDAPQSPLVREVQADHDLRKQALKQPLPHSAETFLLPQRVHFEAKTVPKELRAEPKERWARKRELNLIEDLDKALQALENFASAETKSRGAAQLKLARLAVAEQKRKLAARQFPEGAAPGSERSKVQQSAREMRLQSAEMSQKIGAEMEELEIALAALEVLESQPAESQAEETVRSAQLALLQQKFRLAASDPRVTSREMGEILQQLSDLEEQMTPASPSERRKVEAGRMALLKQKAKTTTSHVALLKQKTKAPAASKSESTQELDAALEAAKMALLKQKAKAPAASTSESTQELDAALEALEALEQEPPGSTDSTGGKSMRLQAAKMALLKQKAKAPAASTSESTQELDAALEALEALEQEPPSSADSAGGKSMRLQAAKMALLKQKAKAPAASTSESTQDLDAALEALEALDRSRPAALKALAASPCGCRPPRWLC